MPGFAFALLLASSVSTGQVTPPSSIRWELWERFDSLQDQGPIAPLFPGALPPHVMSFLPGPFPITKGPPGKFYGPGNVRRDLSTLPVDSPVLQSFRKGVDAMKKLPADDPHSWAFQANIHGFPGGAKPDPLWGQCQHGNWWFLPWHRAYLHYFERIVRKYSEDPTFALPYWDYSAPQSRSLPVAFRDSASPLYDGSRASGVNSGRDQLTALVVVLGTNTSMNNTTFADFGRVATFGGQAINAPEHLSSPHGAIEALPHDLVHAFVGGNMGDTNTAARDPIFFCHHANVDRIWVAWLQMGQGRANPSNDIWLKQTFTFYDENKQKVTIAMRDVVDPAALGYSYDRNTAPPESPSKPANQSVVETVATWRTSGTTLQNQPVSLSLALPNRPQPSNGPPTKPVPPGRIFLQVSEVKFAGSPDSRVDVYVNLPPNTPIPGPNSPSYCGCFTFFGHGGHMGGYTSQIDCTKHLQRLWETFPQQPRTMTVTLVRASPGTLPRDFRTPCTFNQLTLSITK